MQVVRLFGQLDVGADVTWNIQHPFLGRVVSVDVPDIQCRCFVYKLMCGCVKIVDISRSNDISV